ncbi:hypothetical protein VL10_14850 [Leclercia adecarboxylata]|nr:hypothetical protein VL10_14850 [Leclercia adecarboxylata]KMN63710.1 hypothetical protein VK95_18625 [Leclercia sp. LK8]
MADHDPMDLEVRSQVFYRDFYQFHKNSCDAWYIKDVNHRYVDASITFLSRFVPPERKSIVGFSDTDIFPLSRRDSDLMHGYESLAIKQNEDVVILVWGYFTDYQSIKSFILKIKPWYHSGVNAVIVYVSDFAEINKKIDWFSPFISESNSCERKKLLSNRDYNSPSSYLTEKEWEVAWLLICGCTTKWISELFNLNERSVEYKATNAYMKLRVSNRAELLMVAECFGWINFVPKRFATSSVIIRIS